MISKVVFLCAAIAAAHATLHAALINTGSSVSSRQQDDFGNYGFNYGIVDGLGATNSRAEVGDAHGNKKGSYTLTDIDGRARRVDYVADGLGFRAAVKTNEPGTAASAPAAALVDSPYAAPIAPVVVGHSVAAVAPVAAHAAIAAPVYAGVPALVAANAAGPLGYAAGPIGIAGHGGYYASGLVGIGGPVGYAAPVGYAGHLGYGAAVAKAIY